MTDLAPVRRALISVSDKTGLLDLGRALEARGIEILSTGGSARALREAGIAVRDVARKMIEGSGLTVRDKQNPHGDIEIQITGLRPGEKLYEELLIGSDMLTTPHPKILRAQEGHLSEIELAKALKSLSEAIETRDVALLRSVLAQWIEQIEDRPDATVNQ